MVLRDLWLGIGIITRSSKILNSPIGGCFQAFVLRTPRQVARFDWGTSINPVVPAQAGTQSFQVLENTMDWIPA